MGKLLLAVLFALGSIAAPLYAQTTYTISWTNNGSPLSGCGGQGETITQNVTTTVVADGTASTFTTVPGAGNALCPGYNPEFGFVGYSEATLGLPTAAVPVNAPEFNGEGMWMSGWGNYQPATNPQFPTASVFVVASIVSQDGVWAGHVQEWFRKSQSCRYGRCTTIYIPVGGTGSISTTR